jgi:DNA-binding LacI/PurR family transcriptional regulator
MVESDGLAYPAAMACRLLGRRPGSDIIFAGYDGYGLYSWERQFEPVGPQVSMCKQNETIGQELVQTLLADGNAASPDMPQDRVLQPRLVVLDEAFAGPSPSASVVPAAS